MVINGRKPDRQKLGGERLELEHHGHQLSHRLAGVARLTEQPLPGEHRRRLLDNRLADQADKG